MAVISIDTGLIQTGECFFLKHEIWIDEWSNLLGEVDGLIHGNLGSFLLILFKDHSEGLQVLAVVFKVHFNFRASDLGWVFVQAELWKQLMECFHTSWAENFIKNINFIGKFVTDLQETLWKLSNIDESNLQVLSEVWVNIVILKSVNHQLDDMWLTILVKLIDYLLLSFKMDGATHDHEGGVESILVGVRVFLVKEPAASLDDLVVNALLLTLVVDAQVTEHSQGELADHFVILWGQVVSSILS